MRSFGTADIGVLWRKDLKVPAFFSKTAYKEIIIRKTLGFCGVKTSRYLPFFFQDCL